MSATRAAENRVSDGVRAIRPSGIRAFFDLVQQADDVISLGIGEPDLTAPMSVRMQAVNAVILGKTQYTANAGTMALREAIAGYLYDRLHLSYNPAREILVTSGVAQGIDLALRTVVNPGDEVLIPEPCFVSYAPCTQLAGGIPVPVPVSAANGFVLTPEDLAAHITPRTRVLFISYPNNPTGAIMTAEQLRRLVPLIAEYDLTVISDEVYSELVYTGVHSSLVALPGMRDRSILLNGFSKTFAMTGWRLGYAAAPQGMMEAMVRVHQHTLMSASTPAQVAGLHALTQVDEIAAEALHSYDERRRFLYSGLTSIGLACVEPQGAFYAFPSVAAAGMTDDDFAHQLLQEERVAVVPGNAFGSAGGGHVRCSYATSLSNLEQALERMARFVQRHRVL